MGGASGIPDLKDPAGMGGSRAGLESQLPSWAAGDTAGSWLTRAFPGVQANEQNVREATTGTTGVTNVPPSLSANLGFPTATPTQKMVPAAATPASLPLTAAAAPAAPVATPAAAPVAAVDPNAPKPTDWVYTGNLPMDFDPRQGEFGKPRPYAATGQNYTAGYGAAGNFGGVVGTGPAQQGLKDQVLLPEMKAGTALTGAQVDQYNRVRREDYDRYMGLYGVGYDLPAYQQALNGLVYKQNMQNYAPGGGG